MVGIRGALHSDGPERRAVHGETGVAVGSASADTERGEEGRGQFSAQSFLACDTVWARTVPRFLAYLRGTLLTRGRGWRN